MEGRFHREEHARPSQDFARVQESCEEVPRDVSRVATAEEKF